MICVFLSFILAMCSSMFYQISCVCGLVRWLCSYPQHILTYSLIFYISLWSLYGSIIIIYPSLREISELLIFLYLHISLVSYRSLNSMVPYYNVSSQNQCFFFVTTCKTSPFDSSLNSQYS